MPERYVKGEHDYYYHTNESIGFFNDLERTRRDNKDECSPEPKLQEAHDYCSRTRENVIAGLSQDPEWRKGCIKAAFVKALSGDAKLAGAIFNNQRHANAKSRLKYLWIQNSYDLGDSLARGLYDEHHAEIDFSEAVREAIANELDKKHIERAIDIRTFFKEKVDFSSDGRYREAVYRAFWKQLGDYGATNHAERIQTKLGEGIDFKPEDREKAKKLYYRYLEQGNLYAAIMIREIMNDDGFLLEPKKVKRSCKKAIVTCLECGWVGDALSLHNQLRKKYDPKFKIHTQSGFRGAVKTALFDCFRKGDTRMARRIMKELIQPDHLEVIKRSKQYQEAVKRFPSLRSEEGA